MEGEANYLPVDEERPLDTPLFGLPLLIDSQKATL